MFALRLGFDLIVVIAFVAAILFWAAYLEGILL